jgi:hypothetical protein
MPHLHMEYTANLTELNADVALLRLNNALVASGQFAAEFDIKSRAVKLETFRVGTGMGERGFLHVKLALRSWPTACWPCFRTWAHGPLGSACSCAWSCWILTASLMPRPLSAFKSGGTGTIV